MRSPPMPDSEQTGSPALFLLPGNKEDEPRPGLADTTRANHIQALPGECTDPVTLPSPFSSLPLGVQWFYRKAAEPLERKPPSPTLLARTGY